MTAAPTVEPAARTIAWLGRSPVGGQGQPRQNARLRIPLENLDTLEIVRTMRRR